MRTLIKALVVSTAAVLTFSAAQAADVVERVPEAPADVETAPVANWSGAYLGAMGSYNWGRFTDVGSFNARGFGSAAYGGYNLQNVKIVYGVEGDIGYSGNEATRDGIESKQRVNSSIRGRVGYDLNPFLVYGTGGLAIQDRKASDATSSDSRTAVGYTVGAGVETFVTDNVTARAEYRWSSFQNKDFVLDSGTVSRGYDEHSVKLGIGVKF